MRRLLAILIAPVLMVLCSSLARADSGISIFPTPANASFNTRSTNFSGGLSIRADARSPMARQAADAVAGMLSTSGILVNRNTSRSPLLNFRQKRGFSAEAYRLVIGAHGAVVEASDASGLFYGGVTFWQMLASSPDGKLARGIVEDRPALAWRGAMLDSARHFQSPQFVYRFIDWLAAHKMNRFHWHLVDDQGWRIEIKAYPRLTQIAAERSPAVAPGAPELPAHKGFYTQDEIRKIVAYAQARGITIIPEIEMPGHALSAIRAYPEWGMGFAIPAGTESDWGVFPWLYNTREETLGALETIMGEVVSLFPGPYVHIGGDEAVKAQWKASAEVQQQMQTLGIPDENHLQSWFMARIERFLAGRGKRSIGWDEILEGSPSRETIVMSWRGVGGALTAAKAGNDTILSPAPDLYLDHVQGMDSDDPPGRGGVIDLASVLAFEPLPRTIPQPLRGHILGLQGNLWTEHVRTEDRVARMAFPRLSAVAEVGWTGRGSRDVRSFLRRLIPQMERLRAFGLVPAENAWRPSISVEPIAGSDRAKVTLSNQSGLSMQYRIKDMAAQDYGEPFEISLPATVSAQSLFDGARLGAAAERNFSAANIRTRDSRALTSCQSGILLMLEDDYPADGDRPSYQIDVMKPCWIYRNANRDGVDTLELEIGQLPFNFQIGNDREKIRFEQPASTAGEFKVRAGGCDGELIATLPLAKAIANPGVTRLRAAISQKAEQTDLCITYTANGTDRLWALHEIALWNSRMATSEKEVGR
jgi:hexosaminidase